MALDKNIDTCSEDTQAISALHSLFGFNLGFAIEGRVSEDTKENMEQIRKDVGKLLGAKNKNMESGELDYSNATLQKILSDEVLTIIANNYGEYKASVTSRREGVIFTD